MEKLDEKRIISDLSSRHHTHRRFFLPVVCTTCHRTAPNQIIGSISPILHTVYILVSFGSFSGYFQNQVCSGRNPSLSEETRLFQNLKEMGFSMKKRLSYKIHLEETGKMGFFWLILQTSDTECTEGGPYMSAWPVIAPGTGT